MLSSNRPDTLPPGFALLHSLQGDSQEFTRLSWSPNGSTLASPSSDGTITLWNGLTGQPLLTLVGSSNDVSCVEWSKDGHILASGHLDGSICLWDTGNGILRKIIREDYSYVNINSLAWSPDGLFLAVGSFDADIRFWNEQTGQFSHVLSGHTSSVLSLAWSPSGQVLASSSDDNTIKIWNVQTKQLLRTFRGHTSSISTITWSPDERFLASGSDDMTVRIWDGSTGRQINVLEGHTGPITCVSFLYSGLLLASKSYDGTIRIWRCDTWETVVTLEETVSGYLPSGFAVHPKNPVLATLGEKDEIIRIWDLDYTTLLELDPATYSIHYANAKVVLVGDNGVGKSGLSLVLTGQEFVPTESTHARCIWVFDKKDIEYSKKRHETRETFLWDLAGQPGYRLIHQLHLNEAAVALIVFDSHNEIDPFLGVSHWIRALRVAEHVQENANFLIKKFLVAARIDRGGIRVSRERIDATVQELNLDGYFETSAKEGLNITLLAEAIKDKIDWQMLPRVTSNDLFQSIKTFLIMEREGGHLLSTSEDLYRSFLISQKLPIETKVLKSEFATCIGRVGSQGLIRQLSFGNIVLLKPELLDAYASALINSVRDEPDGLGSISEDKVRKGTFFIPSDVRLVDKEQEKLLLIAMIEDLLRYEIALREQGEDATYLVFPSQSMRENSDISQSEAKTIVFHFEGPILNIYAMLAVRLAHSGFFRKKDLWKDAAVYTTTAGGEYGIRLQNLGEGHGELALFFDSTSSEETQFHFEEYIKTHLQRRALPETLQRKRIFTCQECETIVEDSYILKRRKRGFTWITCGVCDTKVSILDGEERLSTTHTSIVTNMDRSADRQREREVANSVIEGRRKIGEFDVFLCYNKVDLHKIQKIANQLKEEYGILPWLDEWELRPGLPWQSLLEKQIESINAAAVFIGEEGIGPWEHLELEAFLYQFVSRECPVIPVILEDTIKVPKLPVFLQGVTLVDFRKKDTEPMERLVWGITGKRNVNRHFRN